MNVAQPITLDGRNGTVSYFNEKLELVSENVAKIAKVIFENGETVFFTVKPK